MDKILIRNYSLFVVILFLCVGILSYVLVSGEKEIDKNNDWVVHSHEIITEIEGLNKIVETLVSSQRGYIISGDIIFWDEFSLKKAKALEHINTLKMMTSDNRSQQQKIKELESDFLIFSKKLEDRAEKFKIISDKQFLDNVESVNSAKNNILKINDNVLDKEYDVLDERVNNVKLKKEQYFLTLLILMIVGTTVLLLLNGYLLNINKKRSKVEKSLKDSEERFVLALAGTQDGIYDWDIKTNNLFCSKQYNTMLGYGDDFEIKTLEDFKKIIHSDDIDKVFETLNLYLNNQLSEYKQEYRIRHKSGKYIWVQSRGKALYDQDGKPYRLVGAHTNISYLKNENEKLSYEKSLAEEANIAKGEFLAHMSHEIRTPLTAISGIAEILEKNNSNFDEKQTKLIKTLNNSTNSLKDLVNDVLDYSKIEYGDIEIEEKLFVLENLISEVVTMMSIRANENGINFTFDITDIEDIDFYGDQKRIRQILVNLIGNALKFTKAGGDVKAKAQFEILENENYLRIDIQDTGIGIAEDKYDLVFEKFKQGDSSVSRKYGGTGLGLPISRNLARLMGGDILIESQVNVGSIFSLALPMKLEIKKKNVENSKLVNQKLSEKIRYAVNKETKALLVEDYEGNVIVIGYILDEMGISYDVANTGKEALSLWSEHYYDFILMDVQMPEMDGFTATKSIREIEFENGSPSVPIIGMTAHALMGDKNKCIDAGMDSYLPKPIVEIDLKLEILKFLDKNKKVA